MEKKHYNVVAAVICNDGEVLCMQRGTTKYAYTSFKWEFPGGKIERGETAEEAVRREILEELAMPVRVLAPLITVSHTYPDFSITMQCFLCAAKSRRIEMREHNASVWLTPEALGALDWAAADVDVAKAVMQEAKERGTLPK